MKKTGFFHKEKVVPVVKKPKAKTVKLARPLDCEGCGLYKNCHSPKMFATGEGQKGILIIAEAPGKDEDEQGKQLVGKAGQVVRNSLYTLGIDLDRDCRKINAVNCRPENNRTPESFEIDCCRQYVWKEIEEFKPKLILLMGNPAIESFLGHRWKTSDLGGVNRWRGWTIPDRDVNAWVCPTFHPSYVARNEKYQPVVGTIFNQDLARAVAKLNEPLPNYKNERECVRVLTDEQAIIAELESLLKSAELDGFDIAFDWEATGRKPYIDGHRIVSCAIADSLDTAIAFPVNHREFKHSERIAELLKQILENNRIGKIAHGLKFEDMWSAVRLDALIENWLWCSMTAAHILDNRGGKPGITGLKFQTYARFGLLDYSSHISAFLKSDDNKDGNAFNRIDDAPIDDLLLYNGMDALLTYRVTDIQMREIQADRQLTEGWELFRDGLISMAEIEQNGIHINIPYVQQKYDQLERDIKNMEDEVENSPEIQRWKAKMGTKFNLNSRPQLGKFLTDDLGIELPRTEPTKSAPDGNPSTDQDSLERIEHQVPFIKKLQGIGRLTKVRNENMKQLLREAPGGVLHPFFDLHIPRSMRSSSSSPNFQNQHARREDLKKIVRTAFIPRPGRQLLEVDFKGLEVAVSACVHRDPEMIRYVSDKTTDMHRDQAMDIFFLPIEEFQGVDWRGEKAGKDTRQHTKGDYVFAEFYGDYYVHCADSLWRHIAQFNLTKKDGTPLYEHLKTQGIKNYSDFGAHLKDVEYKMWYERFKVYTQWKKDHFDRYQKLGYFYMITGFKCTGVMDRKQACNYPIQGPAFHFNLWTINRVRDIAREEKWDSLINGQIHDSAVNDIVPDERDHVVATYKRVVEEDLRKRYSQIIVPLEVEFELTGIDRPWCDKMSLDKFIKEGRK